MNKFQEWELQARICALRDAPVLKIDNDFGPKSRAEWNKLRIELGVTDWHEMFDVSGIARCHLHWTAGQYGVSEYEKGRYNILINQEGQPVEGRFPPRAQATYAVGRAASHTLNCNSHALGLAVDAMHGAWESPFSRGEAPLTWLQVRGLVRVMSNTAMSYWLPMNKWSFPTHAEIDNLFGIRQNAKWDITWLPDMDKPAPAEIVGERIREMARAEMGLIAGKTLGDFIPETFARCAA